MFDASFSGLLRRLRTEAGLTIEELAEASGVSVRGISDLERGLRTAPQRRTAAALAQGLDLGGQQRKLLLSTARAGRPQGEQDPAREDAGTAGGRTLPRDIEDFVGREAELARLKALAESSAGPGPCVVAVSGAPGAGKTMLALHAARLNADRFPDGQAMVDLRGMDDEPRDPTEVMTRILLALGVGEQDLADAGNAGRPALYQRALAKRRCLLLLDNAHNEEQVRPLLPTDGSSMVVVTSRRTLAGLGGVHRLPLAELSATEAAGLLRELIGIERSDREPGAVAEVAERCGHLPLALRVAGNWLATRSGWTVRRLADRLALEERRLDVLAAGDVRVSAAIDLSYRQLTSDAARTFRRLALIDGRDTGAPCVARLTGQTVPEAEDDLVELADAGLLTMEGGRYRLHDLVRLFAAARLRDEEPVEQANRARADMHRWLLETVVVAGRWYEPGYGGLPANWSGLVDLSTRDKARAWLQAEGRKWLAAFRASVAEGAHTLVVEVAESLHWFSDQWIFWGHWPEIYRTSAMSAHALRDPLLEATHVNYHAWALLVCEGRYQESAERAGEALRLAEGAGDATQRAWAHIYLAWALSELGDHDTAAGHNQRAAELFGTVGDLHGSLQALIAQAESLVEAGRAECAVVEATKGLDFTDRHRERLEPPIAALARISLHSLLGRAHGQLKHDREAVGHLRAAVDISRLQGNIARESRSLALLGGAYLSFGREQEARETFKRCLELGEYADPQSLVDARAHLDRLEGGQRATRTAVPHREAPGHTGFPQCCDT
ncbi:helix-turn-helix domain-containing protein [Streptomyces sp. NPDC013178]|uniref:ATP-binding protein n=1 Tax=Streptomyces sp. NPDC013178 TaxID=3155118 RepID=UPI0033C74F0B